MGEKKVDNLVWIIMGSACGLIAIGATTWAASVNSKIERMAEMEVSIRYMSRDISEIKDILKKYIQLQIDNQYEVQ